MALANCSRCGTLFNKFNKTICPTCVDQDEKDLTKVTKFLRANRGCSLEELNEGSGVETEKIYQFIKEKRILAENIEYPCESCDNMINSGILCSSCSDGLNQEIHRAQLSQMQPDIQRAAVHTGFLSTKR